MLESSALVAYRREQQQFQQQLQLHTLGNNVSLRSGPILSQTTQDLLEHMASQPAWNGNLFYRF